MCVVDRFPLSATLMMFLTGAFGAMSNAIAADARSKVQVSPADLVVPANLPFNEQMQRHADILSLLGKVEKQAESDKILAASAKNFDAYVAAETDMENVKKALVPYAAALAQEQALNKEGFVMGDLDGQICKPPSTCRPVDPMTGLFFLVSKPPAVTPALKKQIDNSQHGQTRTEVDVNGFNASAFLQFVSDKPLDVITFGVLPGVRDAIISPNDNGELALIIRDPIKRPVDIVKGVRDQVFHDNGELSKIVRDPIKCTVGRLWHGC